MVVVLAFAATSSLFIWPWAVLPRGKRERFSIWGAQYFAWGCLFVVQARQTVIGTERLPRTGGYLVVSNHRSWLDVALLILHTRSQGVSKREVGWIPFFGLNGWLSGAIFFDRRNKQGRAMVIRDALLLMRGGANVHIFPEGTRTRDGRLSAKVHLRLLQAAAEAGFALVPACTWGTDLCLPATEFVAHPWQPMGIEIGDPVRLEAGESAEATAQRCWDAVVRMARVRGADG